MVNETPPTQTHQALNRLRALAEGNGVSPDKIVLMGAEENIYSLHGVLTLTPKYNVETRHYPGPARPGKGRKLVGDRAALQSAVHLHKEQFENGRGWIEACEKELQNAQNNGWGLNGAEISITELSTTYAASMTCSACSGQQLVTCQQCHGQRMLQCSVCHGPGREHCYVCGGSGNNPADPQQPCTLCHGQRTVLCRQCQGNGRMNCPTCRGKGGTPCPTCKGTGQLGEDALVTCGASTQFTIHGEGLPSGLRRGLDRLGIINLGKGHADIVTLPPDKNEEEPLHHPHDGEPAKQQKITTHKIMYEAKLPYADLRMNFAGRKTIVSLFGKKNVLLNVPHFLDEALKPARDALNLAARSGATLEEALKTRAMQDALQLQLGGQGDVTYFRRLYPFGISQDVMREIFKNLKLALKRQTIVVRSVAGLLCAIISGGVFAGLFLTPLHATITHDMPLAAQAALDTVFLFLTMGLCWFGLNLATRFMLQRRFHHQKVAMQQATGKIGLTVLSAVLLIYVATLFIAPVKPDWFALFIH